MGSTNGPLPVSISLLENLTHFLRSNQRSYQLAAEEHGIWRDGANNIGIHDINQPLSPSSLVPTYPSITGTEIEYWVPQREKADQLVVGTVLDQEPQPSAISLGYGY